MFSTEPTSLGTVLHETGHSPFGLADEYCCDGGYFENPPNAEHVRHVGRLPERRAGAGPDRVGLPDDDRSGPARRQDWFLSEPTPNDLMNATADRRKRQTSAA